MPLTRLHDTLGTATLTALGEAIHAENGHVTITVQERPTYEGSDLTFKPNRGETPADFIHRVMQHQKSSDRVVFQIRAGQLDLIRIRRLGSGVVDAIIREDGETDDAFADRLDAAAQKLRGLPRA